VTRIGEDSIIMPRNRRIPSKNQLRSLQQYKDLPEEEFEKVFESKLSGATFDVEFNTKIKEKLEEFEKDYDLDDLKVNDMATLRSLAQAVIHLENLDSLIRCLPRESMIQIFLSLKN